MRVRSGFAVLGVAAAALVLAACETETGVTIGSDGQPTDLSFHIEFPKAAGNLLGIGSIDDFREAMEAQIAESGEEMPPGGSLDFREEGLNYVMDATTPEATVDSMLESLPESDETPWTFTSTVDGDVTVEFTRAAPTPSEPAPSGLDMPGLETKAYISLTMPADITEATSDGPAPVITGNTARFEITDTTTQISAAAPSGSGSVPVGLLIGVGIAVAVVVVAVVAFLGLRRRPSPAPQSPPSDGPDPQGGVSGPES